MSLLVLGAGIVVACAESDPISSVEQTTGGNAGVGGGGQTGGRSGAPASGGTASGGKGSATTGGASPGGEAGGGAAGADGGKGGTTGKGGTASQGGTGGTSEGGEAGDGTAGGGRGGTLGKGGTGGATTEDPGGAGGDTGSEGGEGGDAGGETQPGCTAALLANQNVGAGGQSAGPVPAWAHQARARYGLVEPGPQGDFMVVRPVVRCSPSGAEDHPEIARLRPDGTVVWQQAFVGADWYIDIMSSSPTGETFIAGQLAYDTTIGGQTFEGAPRGALVIKLDADGNLVWVEELMPPGQEWLALYSIAADGQGGVAFTGSGGTVGPQRMFAGRFDAAGDLRWKRTFGDQTVGVDVVVDSLGEVLVKGWAEAGATANLGGTVAPADGYFLLKLDESGNYRWHQTAHRFDSVARGPGSDLIVLHFDETIRPVEWRLQRIDADGGAVFDKLAIDAPEMYAPAVLGVEGTRIVTVSAELTPTVATFDLNGERTGSYTYGPIEAPSLYDVAVTSGGDILIVSLFQMLADFGFARWEGLPSDELDDHVYMFALRSP